MEHLVPENKELKQNEVSNYAKPHLDELEHFRLSPMTSCVEPIMYFPQIAWA